MQVKRFTAADMRRALELVRQELGDDAVILSSSKKGKSVEILATNDDCQSWLNSANTPEPLPEDQIESVFKKYESPDASDNLALMSDAAVGLNATTADHAAASHESPSEPEEAQLPNPYNNKPRFDEVLSRSINQQSNAAAVDHQRLGGPEKAELIHKKFTQMIDASTEQKQRPSRSRVDEDTGEVKQITALQNELQDMRELLELQLAQSRFAGLTGHQLSADRRLQLMGYSDQFRVEFHRDCNLVKHKDQADAWRATMGYLAQRIDVLGCDLAAAGGQLALVGATGVGKTTTIAKLATRHVLTYGRESLALVTVDNQRLGSQSQLKSLSQILSVPVRSVSSTEQLNETLASLSYCQLVLIDTPGINGITVENDPVFIQLMADPAITKLLVLAANAQQRVQQHLVNSVVDKSIRGAVVTKLDESQCLGETLDVLAQSNLAVAYTTHGQNIPEDIELAKSHNLVAAAVSAIRTRSAKTIKRGQVA